jgi:hypothetical protein
LPDEAWAFLVFIAGKRHVLEEALGAVPGSFPADYMLKDPMYSKARDIFEAADIVDYYPGEPLEEEIGRIIRAKITEAFR